MCCGCGGGAFVGACRNSDFMPEWEVQLVDKKGQTCDYYEKNPSECGKHDSINYTKNDFVARNRCCVCGGGKTYGFHQDGSNYYLGWKMNWN